MEPNSVNDVANQVPPRGTNHAGGVHVGRQHPTDDRQVQQQNQPQPTKSQLVAEAIEARKQQDLNSQTPNQPSPEAPTPQMSTAELILPPVVITKTHLSRILRELGKIDDFFHQASIRGANTQQLPNMSKQLEGIASTNQLNLLQPADRDKLKNFLSRLKSTAPVVHMSFPSEASDSFLMSILEWFRREAHPYTVLHIGLQPELAVGFTMRTTNKAHDFSFRKRFEKSKQKLIASIEQHSEAVMPKDTDPTAAAPQNPATTAQPAATQEVTSA